MEQNPLFAPFRALGYITEDVPFAVQRRGKEAYVTVSVGKCWQVIIANLTTTRLRNNTRVRSVGVGYSSDRLQSPMPPLAPPARSGQY